MKRYLFIVATAAALCVPAAALAGPTPTASQLALQSCKSQQTQLAANNVFKTTYGTNATKSNAFGKCVSKAMQAARSALQNAAEQCKAEQADASFATNHGGKTFDQFYGSGSSKGQGADANAYGKCVSQKAQASTQATTQAIVGAAKSCKADRAADKVAFAAKYHTFGACVSLKAKSS